MSTLGIPRQPMPEEPRTRMGSTLTSEGEIFHKRTLWGDYEIDAPVRVKSAWRTEGTRRPRPMRDDKGVLIYAMPGGFERALP